MGVMLDRHGEVRDTIRLTSMRAKPGLDKSIPQGLSMSF